MILTIILTKISIFMQIPKLHEIPNFFFENSNKKCGEKNYYNFY